MRLEPQTERMLAALAAAFTPTTLAAIRADLEMNNSCDDATQALADEAADRFAKQHAAMVGADEADAIMQTMLFRALPY